MDLLSHSAMALSAYSTSDFFGSSMKAPVGIPLRTLEKAHIGFAERRNFSVVAKLRRGKRREWPWPKDPDPNVKGYPFIYLSEFQPLKEKQQPVILEFEKPLYDLEKKINEVKKMAKETGLDFSDQIATLEDKYQRARKGMYTHLTPYQRLQLARHPNRPTFLDHVFNITEMFVELHGDRAGYDDPAIVCGLGTIDDRLYMFIGHQKGRNTKENIKRNFGMPTPHGYRKALRLMLLADRKGIPIVTFVDTPGAFADLKSEEIGQGEAIAKNLETMFGLKVPIITIVIGEGGSGGALAIACGNKMLMLENSVFYVASPEAAAAILYKSAKAAPLAAKKLKITATELQKLKICDGVIPEPIGGAHADPAWTSQQIKAAINKEMDELTKMNIEELLTHRRIKFQSIGADKVYKQSQIKAMRKVKKMNQMIGKLKKEIAVEYDEAFKTMGLKDRLVKVRKEISKAQIEGQVIDSSLRDEMKSLEDEFKLGLPSVPNYVSLKNKLNELSGLTKAKFHFEKKRKAAQLYQKIRSISNRLKKKYEVLKAEIYSSNDLDESKENKVAEVQRKIDFKLFRAIKSLGVSVSDETTLDKLYKLNELHSAIKQQIKTLWNMPKLKKMKAEIEMLVGKFRKTPNPALKNSINALQGEIQQIFNEATSDLKQQYEQLRTEIFGSSDYAEEDYEEYCEEEEDYGDEDEDDESLEEGETTSLEFSGGVNGTLDKEILQEKESTSSKSSLGVDGTLGKGSFQESESTGDDITVDSSSAFA